MMNNGRYMVRRFQIMTGAPDALLTAESAFGSCPVVIMMMYASPTNLLMRSSLLQAFLLNVSKHLSRAQNPLAIPFTKSSDGTHR